MPDIARFTQLLFADQPLDHLLASVDQGTEPDGPWTVLTEANAHIRQGKTERAVKLLFELIARPNIETRILLWAWTALRNLGVRPKPDEADEIRGIVIEVSMESGVDVLAAYADGAARYVNHSGKVIVWDIPDVTITSLISKLLECSKRFRNVAATTLISHSVGDLIRVTLLTFTGNRFAEASMQSIASSPISQVLAIGAELMANLIKRAESMNRIMPKPSSELPRYKL